MRRGSLVGPVILILIGGVFLLNNIRPDLSVIELLISYWPFLLIGWGFLRLAEILFAASRSSVVPERGVGGGEWGLIVLLCLLGSGAFFARQRMGFSDHSTVVSAFERPNFSCGCGETFSRSLKLSNSRKAWNLTLDARRCFT